MKRKSNVLIGVTGCIAAYKTLELMRLLIKDGFSVKTVLSENVKKFISPLTFKTLSQAPVYTDLFMSDNDWNPLHIELINWADIFVIAPASANTISKIACGIADNLLCSTVLAYDKMIMLVPSMNEKMYKNPILQDNIKRLLQMKNFKIIEPDKGELACGTSGIGRMPEPCRLLEEIKKL